MNRAGAITAVMAVALLTGCSSTSKPKTPSSADNQVAYIATIRSHLGGLNDYTDDQLAGIAHSQCQMLDTGSTTADVVDTMAAKVGTTYTRSDLAYWVGAATSAYCPEHSTT